jgi:serine/threonine-protein kinase HipA
MLISGNNNLSQLKTCLDTAYNFFVSENNALAIIETQISAIEENWDSVCNEAQLSQVDRKLLWGRQFLNPYSTTLG